MKKYSFLLLLVFGHPGLAQSEVIKVSYDFYLSLGDQVHYNSELLLSKNEALFLWGKPTPKEVDESEYELSINLNERDSIGSFTYTNKRSDSLYSRVPYLNKESFIVQESISNIKWRITDDLKFIGPYTSQKAIGTFRGREYTAWFTKDIPINSGPWKLRGLPGLIINASDDKGEIQFLFKSVTKVNATIEPNIGRSETISITDFEELQKSFSKDLYQKMMSKLPRGASLEITAKNAMEIF